MSRIGVRGALLVAFLVASGAPLLVFWLWPHSAALQSEMEEVRDRHLLHARNLASSLEHYDSDLRGAFQSFAPLIAAGRDMEFARDLLRELRFRHFCVVDPVTGGITRAFLSDGVTVPEVLPSQVRRRLLALAAAPLALSPVLPATEKAPPQMLLADWVEGQLVIASVDTEFFQELAGQISFGNGGHAAILDRTGRVIAHPSADWVAQSRPLGGLDPVRRMIAGETGVDVFFSPALGEDVVAGFASVAGPGWGVMVPQPLSELHAKAEAVTRQALVVFAAGLLLSALTALVVSAQLAGSIAGVSAAAKRMARGDANVRVSERLLGRSLSELSRLGASFNAMASQVQEARDRVTALARNDDLTGLLNRAAFIADAQARLVEMRRTGSTAVLFFIDIDRLKAINDGFGHAAGDRLLAQIGRRLENAAGPGDLVARQGGDEFLLLHVSAAEDTAESFGRRILEALSGPFRVQNQRLSVSASIGGSLWPDQATELEELIRQADQAMYQVKASGRNEVRLFDGTLRNKLSETAGMARDLEAGLAQGGLDVVYQPILDLRSGRLASFEALARWTRGESGPVPPEQFVGLAEQTGMIGELGRYVRARALRFGRALAAQGTPVPVAVNLSQIELGQQDVVTELKAEVQQAGLEPSDVILEITESRAMAMPLCPQAVEALHAAGFVLSIDDFGKGLASYTHLLSYRLDRLKIDAAFAGPLATDRRARDIVASLLQLGAGLGLRTTVEGIETAAELDQVVRMGADEVQGFWHRRPMTPADALRYALDTRPESGTVKLAG